MPNTKKLTLATADGTGLTLYAVIRRESDGCLLDDADGSFAPSPADPYLSLTEHASLKGVYERSESRSAWTDGQYTVTAYRQSGGTPSPAADTICGSGRLMIRSDAEILPSAYSTLTSSDLSAATANLDAPVSSRATAADLTGALLPGVFQPSPGISSTDRQRIIRGDAPTLRFNLGSAWNLTGRLAYFTAKPDPSGPGESAIADRACTVTEAASGQCEITLTPEETSTAGLYHAEVEVRDGDDANPLTALQFPLLIAQDVRQ